MTYPRFFTIFLLAAILTASAPVWAADQKIPANPAEIQLSFAPLVKKAAPAVVNIYTKRLVRQRVSLNPFANDPFFQQFFGNGFGSQMREKMENTLGSGVIVRADGIIVTNAHVVKGAQQIAAVLSDGREFEAKLLLADERSDLAVLKAEDIKGAALPTLNLTDSDTLEVGDLVLAIGNPFGVGQTVTSGIVSAVARTSAGISDLNFFIQTDAAINPGNSGGALVNMKGDLVGINSAIFSSREGGGSLGIGFAIPANMVQTVIMTAEAGGKKIKRPWAGIEAQNLTADIAESLGLSSNFGALIKSLSPASPAGKAGLKVGDVVLAINGKEIHDPNALEFRLATLGIGDTAVLGVFRKGERLNVSFKTIMAPETPARDDWQVTGRNPLVGLTVANISPALLEDISAISADQGVAIIGIENKGVQLGVQIGDVILSLNKAKITSVAELKKQLKDITKSWQIQLLRGKQVLSMVVNG